MITVKKLKEKLKEFPDDWELGAYEGEGGIGILLKAPDFNYSAYDVRKTGWIETGVPK